MADKRQSAIGGDVTVPANDSVEIRHKADKQLYISLVQLEATTSPAVTATVEVKSSSGSDIPVITAADDGPDDAAATVALPSTAPRRLFTLVRVDPDDEIVFRLTNSTGSPVGCFVAASAAGTLDVALQN